MPGSRGSAGYNFLTIKRAGIELESDVCFLPMISEQSQLMLRLYRHYQQSKLPFDGGLLQQPNAYLRAMEILSDS